MGHGFGELWKYRGIITHRLSPFELRAFAGAINPGFLNTIKRIAEQVPYIAPPVVLSYMFYDMIEKEHHRLMKKNPADFENDK